MPRLDPFQRTTSPVAAARRFSAGIAGNAARLPSVPIRNPLIAPVPASRANSTLPLALTARSVVCAVVPIDVEPRSARRPAWSIENTDTEPLPALPVKAKCPFGVSATQQAAAWFVGTEPLTTDRPPV